MVKKRKGQFKEVAGLSGTIKLEKGKIMKTREFVKLWSTSIELETKLGTKTGYLIEDPMGLPGNIKRMIFDDFYPVALSAFNQNKSLQFEEDVYHHLFDVDGLVLVFHENVEYRNDKECVEKGIAFRTFTTFETPYGEAMYIEGTAVDPNYHGYGFYQSLTKGTVDGKMFVASRTQNPVVITALSSIFGKVAPITNKPTEMDIVVGEALAEKLKMENYDKEEMIAKDFYGKALNGMLPKIDNDIKKAMYKKIDPLKGDCVIAVCEV